MCCCVSSSKDHPPTDFLLDHYLSSRTHFLPELSFSLGNLFSPTPSPQGHIYSQGNVFPHPSPPSPSITSFPQPHLLEDTSSPWGTSSPQPISSPWPHLLLGDHILSCPISLGNVFSLAYILPCHRPSSKTRLLPDHIPLSPMVLLIRIFMNFHEFFNSLKELMFMVNRGVMLSFLIIDLDQIDDGCDEIMLIAP